MKRIKITLSQLVAAALLPAVLMGQDAKTQTPKRLRRADSFLGIHFDFHAGPDCKEIGKNTTPAMVENIINQVHPDYLQIDCKGHRGLSSYPTKVGNPAPGFVGDPLRVWREVTAARGVALYMHYSGVWDSEAILRHPDWAVINADGKTNANATSFFSPYADQLLVPQLLELAGDYGIDGAWVDGECWASVVDYGPAALRAFREATGIQEVPRKASEPHWFEFMEFNREQFRRYLRHYIAAVKRPQPKFQLCSNWAFSDLMPEPVSTPLDFLSGDYSPQDSVNSARLSARYLARQGQPWDLMAWSFTTTKNPDGSNQKSALQLEREAAVVLALGGGFQAYFQQKRDGSIYDERMPVMGEVARFCRARQAFCHHATQVPQVALLYSTTDYYRRSRALFAPWAGELNGLKGVLQALLEAQNSVEVVSEHHLSGHMGDYPLIVVPECDYLDPAFKSELVQYVKRGGALLLIGPKAAALFETELRVTLEGAPGKVEEQVLSWDGVITAQSTASQAAKLTSKSRSIGQLYSTNNPTLTALPAASVTKLGRGQLAAAYFNLGHGYLDKRGESSRRFLNSLVRQLFPKPLVEVTGSADVDVVVNRMGGRLAVNLVNTAGPHADKKLPIFSEIPSVGPLTVTLRTRSKPSRVTWEPDGEILPFEYRKGEAKVVIAKLGIHGVILVE
jgi:hypothetical protein